MAGGHRTQLPRALSLTLSHSAAGGTRQRARLGMHSALRASLADSTAACLRSVLDTKRSAQGLRVRVVVWFGRRRRG
jgi:hypothetical protein